MRLPRLQLPAIIRQQVGGQVEAEEFVTRSDASRLSRERSFVGEEVPGREPIARDIACKDWLKDEVSALAATELGPHRSNDTLNAGLRVVPNDGRDIDKEARLLCSIRLT